VGELVTRGAGGETGKPGSRDRKRPESLEARRTEDQGDSGPPGAREPVGKPGNRGAGDLEN